MARDFDWNDIPLVISLARTGSMSATARELEVDASTISRRIAAVEKILGQRIFIRVNTRYQLTDAGTVFARYGESVVGDVQSMLLASAREAEAIAGVVRLSAIDFFSDYWLMPQLASLSALHPELEMHFLASNQNVSFTRREADFSLRLAQPNDDAALMMRKLGPVGWTVFGGTTFARVSPREWESLPWIIYEEGLSHLPEMRWIADLSPAPRRIVRVNSLSSMVQACRAGLGLALLPCLMSRDKALVRLTDTVEVQRNLWLLSHRDTSSVARFKVFAAWISQCYENDKDKLCC